jgi:hypothetical protein
MIGHSRRNVLLSMLSLLLAATPATLTAQGAELASRCPGAGQPGQLCQRAAWAAAIMQPRAALVLAGGNPVQGTASTLGLRLGVTPRVSLTGRGTLSWVEIPETRREEPSGGSSFVLPSFNADLAVGVFGGIPVLPTVGGLGSVDLLASVGTAALPGGSGFDGATGSWAVGTRLGILRESFTLPGISASAMYRRVGSFSHGDADLDRTPAYFALSDMSVVSLRGTVGKRLLFIGVTGGAGWDRTSSDVQVRVRDAAEPGSGTISQPSMTGSRSHFFANASWTTLVLHVVGEAGIQRGGTADADAAPAVRRLVERRGFYAGLALRLAI